MVKIRLEDPPVELGVSKSVECHALTLLVGLGHPTCKMLGAGVLVVTIGLELCTSYGSSYHHLHHPCSNKIQNGDILLPAYAGCHGKWPLNECCCCCINQSV